MVKHYHGDDADLGLLMGAVETAFGLELQIGESETDLLYKSKADFLDDGPEKSVRIWSRIGRRPLVAGGNSNGDIPMSRLAHQPGSGAMRLLVSTTTQSASSITSPERRTPCSWPRIVPRLSSASKTTGPPCSPTYDSAAQ